MSSPAAGVAEITPRPSLPPGYRPRRGLNWGIVGLMYTSYYLCRYNFSLANKAISDEFGFSKAQMGQIISSQLLCYACGQALNASPRLMLTTFMPSAYACSSAARITSSLAEPPHPNTR